MVTWRDRACLDMIPGPEERAKAVDALHRTGPRPVSRLGLRPFSISCYSPRQSVVPEDSIYEDSIRPFVDDSWCGAFSITPNPGHALRRLTLVHSECGIFPV